MLNKEDDMTTIKQQSYAKALKRLLAQEKRHTLAVDEKQKQTTSVRLQRGFYLLNGEGVER